ncbi:MAG: undecaprenyl diphosphate synthase family protein, partial [Lentisphaeria bacterium]|nr:undecaprenyl diphosphate synthase family protein [Lentisphaeria bacterium]
MAKKNELTHLAIILDGNGRWAEKHGVPRVKGHEAGAERVMQIVK